MPYVGLALGFVLVLVTLLGYGSQADQAVSLLNAIAPIILPPSIAVTTMGVVNKAQERKQAILQKQTVQEIIEEIEKAKAESMAPPARDQ